LQNCDFHGIINQRVFQVKYTVPDYARPLINLYARDIAADMDLVRLSKSALENSVGFVTVPVSCLDRIWRWLENSGVVLCACVHAGYAQDEAFRNVRAAIKGGAGIVEAAPPLDMLQSESYLSALSEGTGGHALKICIETDVLKSVGEIKSVARRIPASVWIKTSSGRIRGSSLEDLNAVLESSENPVDFLFDVRSSDEYVIDSAYRLAARIKGAQWVAGNFVVSKLL
jgi:Zn ribbon nucleic-acid-binding protein